MSHEVICAWLKVQNVGLTAQLPLVGPELGVAAGAGGGGGGAGGAPGGLYGKNM
jgi:hypothetical protein